MKISFIDEGCIHVDFNYVTSEPRLVVSKLAKFPNNLRPALNTMLGC